MAHLLDREGLAGGSMRCQTGNTGGENGLNIAANEPVHVRIEPSLVASCSTADRLRELASLHAGGLIEEGEY